MSGELDRIRREAQERAKSKEIGGARWQFDIHWLIQQIDERDATLNQVRAMTNQAIRTATPVNAYRLDAALKGDKVTGPATDGSLVSLEQVWDEGHEEGVIDQVCGRERAENPYKGS